MWNVLGGNIHGKYAKNRVNNASYSWDYDTVLLLVMSHAARDDRSNAALKKADKFAAENCGGRRVRAKQAILHELNVQLKLRSERLKSQYSATGDAEPALSCQNGHSSSPLRCNLNNSDCAILFCFFLCSKKPCHIFVTTFLLIKKWMLFVVSGTVNDLAFVIHRK